MERLSLQPPELGRAWPKIGPKAHRIPPVLEARRSRTDIASIRTADLAARLQLASFPGSPKQVLASIQTGEPHRVSCMSGLTMESQPKPDGVLI